jgi:hypothetical protein
MLADFKKAGVTVSGGTETRAHYEIRNDFPMQFRRMGQNAIDTAEQYLSGTLIRDRFGEDHEARRAWRHTMRAQYGDAFAAIDDSSKIRGNFVNALHGYIQGLVSVLGDDSSAVARRIRSIAASLPDVSTYQEMPTAEKLRIIKVLDKVAQKALDALSEKT